MSLDAWVGREFAGKKIVGVNGKNAIWKDDRGVKIITPFAYLARFYEYEERIPEGSDADASQAHCFNKEAFDKILMSFRVPVTAQLVMTNMGLDITRKGLAIVEAALEHSGMVHNGRTWERGPSFGGAEKPIPPPPARSEVVTASIELRAFVTGHTTPGGCAPLRSLYSLWTGEELTFEEFVAKIRDAGFKVGETKNSAVIYGLRVREDRMDTKSTASASAAIEKAAAAIESRLVDSEMADVIAEIKAQTDREALAIEAKYASMKSALDDWRAAARKAAFNSVRVKLGLAQPSDEVSIAAELLRHSMEAMLGKA